MSTNDPRVDAYIARAAPFAQPILNALRSALHEACPDAEETIKWGMPFFEHAGRPLAHMAAFKQHCGFGIWRGRELAGQGKDGEAMGQFGRITSLAELPPPREFKAVIRAAMRRIDDAGDTAAPKTAASARPALVMPDDLQAALAAAPAARKTYDAFAPGKQRDYLEWVLEAKRAETRAKRIAQAVEWLAEGKARHWKYEKT
jgi:uncharacterized protein YdeI (YjbR/CyaY-like superfamily)